MARYYPYCISIERKISNARQQVGYHTTPVATDLRQSGQLDSADSIINHLLAKNYRSAHYHTLKGQVFEARQQYDSALIEYDYAIAKESSSNARDRRAGICIVMGRYNDALADYKTIYFFNYDYSYQIGQVFETMNQKDSALKYYTIFLEHYNDTAVQRKVERLKK